MIVTLSAKQFEKSIQLLRTSLETLAGLAIVTYFSGWNYFNEYFSSFNVNRSSFVFNNYTVFLYSFSVILEIPRTIIAFTWESNFGLVFLALTFVGMAIEFRRQSESTGPGDRTDLHRIRNVLVRRVLLISCGFAFIYLFSIEAGRLDAQQVSQGDNARQIDLIVTPSFYEALKAQNGQELADLQMSDLSDANRNDALALVWRNSEETLILHFDTTEGTNHGQPIATYRIPNEFVALLETRYKVIQ